MPIRQKKGTVGNATKPNLRQRLVPQRKTRPGPERDLVERYVRTVRDADRDKAGVVLKEIGLPTGYPDIVIVEVAEADRPRLRTRDSRGAIKAYKLLQFLYARGHCEITRAAKMLGSPVRTLEKIAKELASSGFLSDLGSPEMLQVRDRGLGVSRIVAIEAKIKDWKGALRQAMANTWFASHSYVLMPAESVSTECLRVARSLGIGVIAEKSSHFVELLAPAEVQLPASYGSWLVVEVATRQKVRKKRERSAT